MNNNTASDRPVKLISKLTNAIIIALLYLLLFFGGLWNSTGRFETAMLVLAGPLLILMALFVATIILVNVECPRRAKYIAWFAVIFLLGLGVEAVGVHTGIIFGSYHYGSTLGTMFLGVPIAIGFAWVLSVLTSLALAQRLIPERLKYRRLLLLISATLLLVVFDAFLEPAAMKLGYWSWDGNAVPLQNYLAWGLTGAVMFAVGWRFGLLERRLPTIAVHAWFAQIIYFLVSIV